MTSTNDIILPLHPRKGAMAIIKATLESSGYATQTAWALPGGTIVTSRREACKAGTAIFKAAGWK